MINLSSFPLTKDQISVLSLGLTFCPMQKVDQFQLIKEKNLFSCKLMFKILHDKPKPSVQTPTLDNPLWKQMTISDIKAMEELMELWEEGNIDETEYLEAEHIWSDNDNPGLSLSPSPIISTPKDYKPKSKVFPTLQGNPNVWAFTNQVTKEICQTKWKDLSHSNLTSSQKMHCFHYNKTKK